MTSRPALQLPALPAVAASDAVVVGLSGGLDSTVLLHLLSTSAVHRQQGLRAVHVHHGLHPDADHWASHCADLCAALGIELGVLRIDVDRNAGLGLEGAARQARHAAFVGVLRQNEILALAHHRDDQAETFLLRALRASGPDGLAAMRAWRSFAQGWLWRPLLDTPRADLLAYAQAHALRWIEDPSNLDTSLDRNFLRRRLLPLLRERWPQADVAFARSAALQAETVDLLSRDDALALASAHTSDPQTLSVAALQRLPQTRRARVLRNWIAQLGLPPLPAHGVAAIQSTLLHARPDASPQFAWSGAHVQRWRELLHADWQRAPLPAEFCQPWSGSTPLQLPTGDCLQFKHDHDAGPQRPAFEEHAFEEPALEGNAFIVHARRGGERITLPGRGHSHALKHVLQERGVPPWLRARLPLLSGADGGLLAAGDLVSSAAFDARLRAAGVRLQWRHQTSMPQADGLVPG